MDICINKRRSRKVDESEEEEEDLEQDEELITDEDDFEIIVKNKKGFGHVHCN